MFVLETNKMIEDLNCLYRIATINKDAEVWRLMNLVSKNFSNYVKKENLTENAKIICAIPFTANKHLPRHHIIKGNRIGKKLHGSYEEWFPGFTMMGKTSMIDFTKPSVLMKKCVYKDGKIHGKCQWYHSNGRLRAEANLVDGKIDGELVQYNQNGSIYCVAQYKNGVLHGTVVKGERVYYIEDGDLCGIMEGNKFSSVSYGYFSFLNLIDGYGLLPEERYANES